VILTHSNVVVTLQVSTVEFVQSLTLAGLTSSVMLRVGKC